MFPARSSRLLQSRRVAQGISGVLLACSAWMGWVSRAEAPPKPAFRVPLKELGFPGYVTSLMHVGASVAGVHMLDDSHVLFTYSLRSLVPRLPGDDANDTDRQVGAVLVEVPSGKVLARTKWHLHDYGQYLWSLGHGVFALRSGSEMSLFAPMHSLAAGEDPFLRIALPHRSGKPELVMNSPDGKVVTVEVSSPAEVATDDSDQGGKRKHYTLEFFRLSTAARGGLLEISGAGAVGSPVPLRLALDGDGYLWAEDGERGKWMVSFNEFGGKQQPITSLLSSCHPRLNLLSRSQFLAETCRGSDQRPMLAAYGFDGHENWEEEFGEALQPPTLKLAPGVGRFAVSRLIASSTGGSTSGSSLIGDDPVSQEVRVYQTESGDLLFHLQCLPAVRSSENFDLSPDGRTLVLLGRETMDFYRLPELSAKDRKDLAEVQAMTPPVGSGPVLLSRITRRIDDPAGATSEPSLKPALDRGSVALANGAGMNASPSAAQAATGSGGAPAGDPVSLSGAEAKSASAAVPNGTQPPQASDVRRPPTLLNPGESAEYKGQSPVPK
jgi:hypothetical protein